MPGAVQRLFSHTSLWLCVNYAHATTAHCVEQIQDVVDYCQEKPEILSWLDYFDDPPEEEVRDMDEDDVRVADYVFDKDLAR